MGFLGGGSLARVQKGSVEGNPENMILRLGADPVKNGHSIVLEKEIDQPPRKSVGGGTKKMSPWSMEGKATVQGQKQVLVGVQPDPAGRSAKEGSLLKKSSLCLRTIVGLKATIRGRAPVVAVKECLAEKDVEEMSLQLRTGPRREGAAVDPEDADPVKTPQNPVKVGLGTLKYHSPVNIRKVASLADLLFMSHCVSMKRLGIKIRRRKEARQKQERLTLVVLAKDQLQVLKSLVKWLMLN